MPDSKKSPEVVPLHGVVVPVHLHPDHAAAAGDGADDAAGEEDGSEGLKDESQEKGHPEADGAGADHGAPGVGRVVRTNSKSQDEPKDDGQNKKDVAKVILEGVGHLPVFLERKSDGHGGGVAWRKVAKLLASV